MVNRVLRSGLSLVCLLLITGGITGCPVHSSMDTVRRADLNAGRSRTFAGNYDTISAAAIASVEGLNVEITETSTYSRGLMILANKPLSAWSWGEILRVIVERGNERETTVWVRSEPRVKSSVESFNKMSTSEEDFAEAIFEGIESYLLLLRR